MTRVLIAALAMAATASGACGHASSPEATCVRRAADPPRTIVESPCGTEAAVFTDGAYSVRLRAAERRFDSAAAANGITTRDWVRVLPAPFGGTLDAATRAWLDAATGSPALDVLALAMQYVEGAPPVRDGTLEIAGRAEYGPLSDAGERLEGSDFNDYLGIAWTYGDGTVDRPETSQFRCLDCSGYMRMVWGYRCRLPLAAGAVTTGDALARRAVQMDASTFGVVVLPNTGAVPADLGRLQAGDLVFFDADPDDGPAVDHVGLFLGRDDGGHYRFLSSRKSANGPTLGDLRGASILDGNGLYARALRSARRL